MNLTNISAFQDNYIWVLSNPKGQCIIVDPGDADPVINAITSHQWQPEAILLTHHHADHVGGVARLKQRYPDLIVYGPAETRSKGATRLVSDGDQLQLLGHVFTILATPGHTAGHISYYGKPWLFCGDTLFSAGCGRLFEGTADQMYQSFQKLNTLPADTLICCAHEYTLSNVLFALSLLPEDPQLLSFYYKVKMLRAEQHSTLPSTLEVERKVNVFLRTEDDDLKRKIPKELHLRRPDEIFAWLRAKKDSF